MRYNPGGQFSIGNTIMGNPGEAKYGMPGAAEEGLAAEGAGGAVLRAACLPVLQHDGQSYYPELAGLLLTLGKELAEETGLRFAFMDLSGGIGIPYRPEESAGHRPPSARRSGRSMRARTAAWASRRSWAAG